MNSYHNAYDELVYTRPFKHCMTDIVENAMHFKDNLLQDAIGEDDYTYYESLLRIGIRDCILCLIGQIDYARANNIALSDGDGHMIDIGDFPDDITKYLTPRKQRELEEADNF